MIDTLASEGAKKSIRQLIVTLTFERSIDLFPIFQLIDVSVSEGARQVAPVQQAASSTILKLIDALISEVARFGSNLYQRGNLDSSQLIVYMISAKRASKLIVIYSKSNIVARLHTCLIGKSGLVGDNGLDGRNVVGLIKLIELIGLVGHTVRSPHQARQAHPLRWSQWPRWVHQIRPHRAH